MMEDSSRGLRRSKGQESVLCSRPKASGQLAGEMAGRDGRRHARISTNREGQSDLVGKRQAQEESVKHAVAAGDVEGHRGRRRDGARQAQFNFPVRCIGSTGLSVGAGNVSKPRRRRRRTEQRLGGLSTIVADSLVKAAVSIRWVPHPQMSADGLAKAELAKTTGTLEHSIKTGHFTLVQEQKTMKQ